MLLPASRYRLAHSECSTIPPRSDIIPTRATKKKSSSPAKPRSPRKKAAPTVSPAPQAIPTWLTCARAAEDKKAFDIKVLDLQPVTSFADYFVIASASNIKQAQAIADSVIQAMKDRDDPPNSVEGYPNAEWVLIDFGDLVVHVFTEKSRAFYDLDRLWRDAPSVPIPAA